MKELSDQVREILRDSVMMPFKLLQIFQSDILSD